MSCGGIGEEKVAHEELQSIVDSVKEASEAKTGKKYSKFNALKYRSQVVAGTNYFVKVDVGDDTYLHIKIFQPLPHTELKAELTGVQENKKLEDPLSSF